MPLRVNFPANTKDHNKIINENNKNAVHIKAVGLRSLTYFFRFFAINEIFTLIQAGSDYHLIFKRILWYFPLSRLDSNLFVDFLFNQVLPDFLDGHLFVFEENRFVCLKYLYYYRYSRPRFIRDIFQFLYLKQNHSYLSIHCRCY